MRAFEALGENFKGKWESRADASALDQINWDILKIIVFGEGFDPLAEVKNDPYLKATYTDPCIVRMLKDPDEVLERAYKAAEELYEYGDNIIGSKGGSGGVEKSLFMRVLKTLIEKMRDPNRGGAGSEAFSEIIKSALRGSIQEGYDFYSKKAAKNSAGELLSVLTLEKAAAVEWVLEHPSPKSEQSPKSNPVPESGKSNPNVGSGTSGLWPFIQSKILDHTFPFNYTTIFNERNAYLKGQFVELRSLASMQPLTQDLVDPKTEANVSLRYILLVLLESSLSPEKYDRIVARYGLNGEDPQKLREIPTNQCTAEAVRQSIYSGLGILANIMSIDARQK